MHEMSDDDEKNLCTICLQSLSDAAFGAVYPCGHVFHEECWQRWEASQLGRQRIKCATCNRRDVGFCRLFLDISGLEENGNDDDDDSLSSCSSSVGAAEAENTTTSSGNASRNEAEVAQVSSQESEEQAKDNRANDDDEVVVIVDTGVPPVAPKRNKRSDDPPNNSKRDTSSKYKRLAKKFKCRNASLESKHEQLKNEHQELGETLAETKQELTEQEEKHAHLEQQYSKTQRQWEGANLQIVELNHELRTVRETLSKEKSSKEILASKLEDIHVRYDVKLKRAEYTSVAEFKRLVDENQRLKEKLREQQRFSECNTGLAANAEEFLFQREKSDVSNHFPLPPKKTPKLQDTGMERATKTTKLLREMDESFEDSMLSKRKRPPDEEVKQALQKSANAALVSRAIARKPASRPALEMLDRSSSLPPQPKKLHSKKQGGAPPTFALGINVRSGRRHQTIVSRGLLGGTKKQRGVRRVSR